MEIIEIAQKIEEKIAEIKKTRSFLRKRAEEKANAIANYEKTLAKTIIGLKNGEEYELEGQMIKNPGVSYTEKIARGICWEEKLKTDLADSMYKNNIIALETMRAELSGLQSQNRFLPDL